jgi:hypothetical protein
VLAAGCVTNHFSDGFGEADELSVRRPMHTSGARPSKICTDTALNFSPLGLEVPILIFVRHPILLSIAFRTIRVAVTHARAAAARTIRVNGADRASNGRDDALTLEDVCWH